MHPFQKSLGERKDTNTTDATTISNDINAKPQTRDEVESLDVIIIGAGFSGVYLLHHLRKHQFSVKIIEAGSGLGGVWHWNRYPGARVDSQYPTYALSLPEIYRDWHWSSHYPDHTELREYFQHIDKQLDISKDTLFDNTVTEAVWDDRLCKWTVRCDTGRILQASFLLACTGFAAKRHFPDWKDMDTFKGFIHHSSFWPENGVDVRGKRCAVVGSGATGVQIVQEWGREIGADGSLLMFQRTPNMCCPMRQISLTLEEQELTKHTYDDMFKERMNNFSGFLYQSRLLKTLDHSAEEREALYWELWRLGGFRYLQNNYFDMTRNQEANAHAYRFWRDRVRERLNDPVKAELLAPTIAPHAFGGKRVSLEQDFYEQFNKPNVNIIDVRKTPIQKFTEDGIVTSDGTLHRLDVIALATGFDAITGGLKNIKVVGMNGQTLANKWDAGAWTYLGLTTSGFPNFFFTYGPQAPTAFSNGPSSVELQSDWIVDLLIEMRSKSLAKVDANPQNEKDWKEIVRSLSAMGLRDTTDSWYNGTNIPGKPREPLNYAGGIPLYKKTIEQVRADGYRGFTFGTIGGGGDNTADDGSDGGGSFGGSGGGASASDLTSTISSGAGGVDPTGVGIAITATANDLSSGAKSML